MLANGSHSENSTILGYIGIFRRKFPHHLLPLRNVRYLWSNGKFSSIFRKFWKIAVPFTAGNYQILVQWKAPSISLMESKHHWKTSIGLQYNVYNLKVDTLTLYKLHCNGNFIYNSVCQIKSTLSAHNLYLCITLVLRSLDFFSIISYIYWNFTCESSCCKFALYYTCLCCTRIRKIYM